MSSNDLFNGPNTEIAGNLALQSIEPLIINYLKSILILWLFAKYGLFSGTIILGGKNVKKCQLSKEDGYVLVQAGVRENFDGIKLLIRTVQEKPRSE